MSGKRRRGKKGKDKYSPNWAGKSQVLTWSSPPIWFKPNLKKQTIDAEVNKDSKAKEETKEVELMLNPSEEKSTTIKKKCVVLRNPDPESWVIWVREFAEICESVPIKDPRAKSTSALQFLASTAKEAWQKHYAETVASKSTYLNDKKCTGPQLIAVHQKIFDETVMKCTREFFHMEQPARRQVSYMRYYLSTDGYTIREFANRLKVLNSYLPYFPPKQGNEKIKSLDNDELVDILVRASPVDMAIATMKANLDPYKMSWDGILNYLERLELSNALEKQAKGKAAKSDADKTPNPEKGGKRKKEGSDEKSSPGKKNEKPKRWCTYCENGTHNTEQCWFKDKKPAKKSDGKNGKTERTFTVEQVHALLNNMHANNASQGPAKKKRRISYDSSSEEDENTNVLFSTQERSNDRT